MTGKILTGGKSEFKKIEKGLGELLFERADLFTDNIFQIDALTGEKETFGNVKLRSTRLAISLQKLGITSKDIILTCLKINIDTVIPHLATLYLGAKYAGIDPIQTTKDWYHCISLVKPKLMFVDENQLPRIKKCLRDMKMKPEIIVYGESIEHPTFKDLVQPSSQEISFRPKVIENCRDDAVILFSSGTTGLPKAMTLSHFGAVNGRLLVLEMYGTKFFSVELIFSSYYWITSLMLLVRRFFTGGALVLLPKFHPEDALMAIEKYKVSSCNIAPAAGQHLLKVENIRNYDLSSVKLYISGGTSISPEHLSLLKIIFREAFVLNTYGSTESGGIATKNDFDKTTDPTSYRLRTVGKCLKDTWIKIVDGQSGKILGPNQPGEIWTKSLYGINGYYNNTNFLNLDSDGFHQSGDVGYYDENDYIYVIGRSNEMFKYGTLKVVPENWEAVLRSHPSVHEVAVFGIPHGSDGWLPAACIALKEHAKVTVAEIEGFFIENMTERHRLVGGIRFVKEIPKTPSSKVRRTALLDVFNTGIC